MICYVLAADLALSPSVASVQAQGHSPQQELAIAVFERNVGTGSKLGIPRGINSLWTNGGIQYAPPIR